MLIVDRNVKFHSSLTQVGLFTVENVGKKEDPREEDISFKLTSFTIKNIFSMFFILVKTS